MSIFLKGVTHDFSEKIWNFFRISFSLKKKYLDMMFNNVLNRKKGFLPYKNVILTKCENVRFSKGVNPWVSSKIWKYFWVLKFFEKDLYMVFNYILNGKKGFLDYKNVNLTLWENVHYFFLSGCPLICIKNRTFLLSLIFFEKDRDTMFKYLLNNIKNFLDYKNVILTYSKHDHFSKGGNPGFSSKIWKFFWVSFSLKKTYTWCLIMFWIKKEFLDYKNVILT